MLFKRLAFQMRWSTNHQSGDWQQTQNSLPLIQMISLLYYKYLHKTGILKLQKTLDFTKNIL